MLYLNLIIAPWGYGKQGFGQIMSTTSGVEIPEIDGASFCPEFVSLFENIVLYLVLVIWTTMFLHLLEMLSSVHWCLTPWRIIEQNEVYVLNFEIEERSYEKIAYEILTNSPVDSCWRAFKKCSLRWISLPYQSGETLIWERCWNLLISSIDRIKCFTSSSCILWLASILRWQVMARSTLLVYRRIKLRGKLLPYSAKGKEEEGNMARWLCRASSMNRGLLCCT